MRYKVTHTTAYSYQQTVGLSYNEVRMLPRPTPNQQVIDTQLQILPSPSEYRVRNDFFGNQVAWFSIREPHQTFEVTAISEVRVIRQPAQMDLSHGVAWETAKQILHSEISEPTLDARQYALDSPLVSAGPELAAYAKPSFAPGRALPEAIRDLMQRIYRDFTFDPEFTTLSTPLATVLEHRRGVCQDFAHLAIGCIRSQGLAARYVSGYIETLPPPGQPKLVGADASHAWFSVYLPDLGWMDFDPTNNQTPGDQHIVVAWGRDYSDVTPLKGVIFGGQDHELSVSVEMENLGQ
ncbi:transglutaminase family protein [Methylomonas sp. EFPC3]|uniref:transglutaminase family protein n=1 Tax=Methylomonas sp. EFPC3 TaxID=3021710 RepID=UPI00241641F4|nr:transglutaminase family protein [Methylomonas sp. EFPC3]WFP52270.1 transglutaminase family protein [Methylomonas sp. EFPC3]